MKTRSIMVACAALTWAAGMGCSGLNASNAERASKNTTAPDFTLKDVNGKTVRLSDFRGKPVLLAFWAFR